LRERVYRFLLTVSAFVSADTSPGFTLYLHFNVLAWIFGSPRDLLLRG
jgi:hypothetical protein